MVPALIIIYPLAAVCALLLYVTGFMKTGPNHTRTEIHFIA